MGDVVALTVWKATRDARARVAARLDAERALHPSLRWVAGTAYSVAHRKEGVVAACGAAGRLMLATPGVPLCPDCYPGR